MTISISNITYNDLITSNATLVQYTVPVEGQTFLYVPQQALDNMSYPLSKRNGSGAYILPMEVEKVYLNFIAQKTIVTNLKDYIDTDFNYFIVPEVIPPDLFSLPDGTIFRCTSSNSLPKSKESYVYYIMEEGKKKVIPNYQSLEVMLFERNQTLLSIRIITEQQCSEIPPHMEAINDKSQSWNEDMKDQTNFEALKALEGSVATGAALAEGAKAAAGTQIAAVKAEAEASKAQAEQAKAEAEASALAAQAAIAEAEAAKAAAELAILQTQNNS